MLDLSELEGVLEEYIDEFIPAMLRRRYHLILVKGGPEYSHLPEQSHFAHIINGVFGLAELVKFLIKRHVNIPRFDELTFRKVLALFTIHEVHKDDSVNLLGSSKFGIPLERLQEEYTQLGLDRFVALDEHLMRAANVHKRSPRHGDLLLSLAPEASQLWLWVRIADTFASVKTPEEAIASLKGYLADLGPFFAPKSPPGQYTLYYHQIKDVRGVLTRLIHQAVAEQLEQKYGFFPLIYFTTGTLYVGPTQVEAASQSVFIQGVIDGVLSALTRYGREGTKDAARLGLRLRRYDFQDFVYSFADVNTLLTIAKELAEGRGSKGKDVISDIDKLLGKKGVPEEWDDTEIIANQLELDLKQPDAFMDHWDRARYYLMYADHIVAKLYVGSPVKWLLEKFPVPRKATENLHQIVDAWSRGGFGKYVVPVSYHFLKGPAFADRAAEALPPEKVLDRVHRHTLDAIAELDTRKGREQVVAELGFRQDLANYLNEHLYLSFAPEMHLSDDALVAYSRSKKKGHSNTMCSLCNRHSEYVQPLRTGILDDFGRVFSNRVLPAMEAPGDLRPWCPICHLEFILRKLVGLGLPGNANYGNSYRVYLYVLPTFSFTSNHLRLYQPLLRQFRRVTSLPVRDYGKDAPSTPRVWLEQREFDTYWVEDLMEVFERQTEQISKWGGREYVGERMHTSPIRAEPHYYLIVWEKAAYQQAEETQIASRTEAWAKALFAATIISGLTSCKIYVTERPYLPMTDPVDLKPTITLDSPPPALRGLLGERSDNITLYGREKGYRSGLEKVLDLSAALWMVTTSLRPNRDKNIARRLEQLNVNPLAGAFFYKEYGRENEGESPFPVLTKACEVLLEIQGGEMMGLVERIGEKSLQIGLPLRGGQRGKAHRYELVLREGMDALRKAFKVIPELRETALTGQSPSRESVDELKNLAAGKLLKAMPRKQNEIFVNPLRQDMGQMVGELIDVLVEEVYLNRAEGDFARFLRMENSLADGIYYYTDRHLSEKWDAYNAAKAKREAKAQS